MAHPVRIGIVGCGSVMQSYMRQIEVLAKEGHAEVVWACDVREERGAFMRETYGVDRFTTRFEDVVQSDDVDLVLVLTAMPAHGSLTRAALEAGKHVLVEKPMSVDLAEATELVELSKESEGFLVPAPHVLLSETYQTVWRRLHAGDIGKVTLARARYGWSGPPWGKWFYQEGGGCLFDLGVYNIVTLTGWLGPVQRVTALTGTAIPRREVEGEMIDVEVEDNAHVLLDFGDAVFAVVTTGFTMQKSRGITIELYGTEGTIQLPGYDWAPEGYEMWQNTAGNWQVFLETDRKWPWTDGIRHTVECIQTGEAPLVTAEHGLHTLEIMVKAKEAGADGRAREIKSRFDPPTFNLPDSETSHHLDHSPSR